MIDLILLHNFSMENFKKLWNLKLKEVMSNILKNTMTKFWVLLIYKLTSENCIKLCKVVLNMKSMNFKLIKVKKPLLKSNSILKKLLKF